MTNDDFLQKLMEVIKSELSPNEFNIWFKSTNLEINDNKTLTIYAANEFASDWIRNNYLKLLKTTAEKILDKEVDVIITSSKPINS